MNFDFPGYALRFVQKDRCRDGSAHLSTHVFTFHSPKTGYKYVLLAEYFDENLFAIKFYCKKDKRSIYRFNSIVNKGDVGNIFITCASVIPLLLSTNPSASFAFAASHSVNRFGQPIETSFQNQRFKTYAYLAAAKFGKATFHHIAYPEHSCYLLLNRQAGPVSEREDSILAMFRNTFQYFPL